MRKEESTPPGALRVAFDLYANIRPCRSRDGLTILRRPMDLVIVRENTEGFYSDRNMHAGGGEFMPDEDMALSVRKITARGSARIARVAFELARGRRKKVTAVHKANVLKLSDGLFLREVRMVAADFPDVELDEVLVDAAAALLVRTPDRFDVIVTTNMYGDILSDEASELSGSLGLGASINVSDRICHRPGAAWLRPGHSGKEPRESNLADSLDGDAARLARTTRRQSHADRRRRSHRERGRAGAWESSDANPRRGRHHGYRQILECGRRRAADVIDECSDTTARMLNVHEEIGIDWQAVPVHSSLSVEYANLEE